MNNIIDKLRQKYPDKEFVDADIEIIEKCIDGNYTEDDFFYACEKLFKTTKAKSIKCFQKKKVFIDYRNMHRDNFPAWVSNLSYDDQFALKEIYREIVSRLMLEHDYYNCNHPDILELIQAYHKESVPYWCIRACIIHELNYYIPMKKQQLIEFMNNAKIFKEKCKEIYRKNRDFKKESQEYLKEIGVIK
jgi:hypothetical protein